MPGPERKTRSARPRHCALLDVRSEPATSRRSRATGRPSQRPAPVAMTGHRSRWDAAATVTAVTVTAMTVTAVTVTAVTVTAVTVTAAEAAVGDAVAVTAVTAAVADAAVAGAALASAVAVTALAGAGRGGRMLRLRRARGPDVAAHRGSSDVPAVAAGDDRIGRRERGRTARR